MQKRDAGPQAADTPIGSDLLCIRVVDDGVGFDPEARQSKGLANLRKRAVSIGAQLRISSVPGKTVVEIQLDV